MHSTGNFLLLLSFPFILEFIFGGFVCSDAVGCIWEFCGNSSKQTAVVRASDDFYPRDPVSHTVHIAAVAYNSVFLGEFMQPDWDMFHSLHPAAEYHASARAISGGPLYVR